MLTCGQSCEDLCLLPPSGGQVWWSVQVIWATLNLSTPPEAEKIILLGEVLLPTLLRNREPGAKTWA